MVGSCGEWSRHCLRPGAFEADARTRTADLLITNELLYQLSYIGSLPPESEDSRGTYHCAAPQSRTGDPQIFSLVLYQLS